MQTSYVYYPFMWHYQHHNYNIINWNTLICNSWIFILQLVGDASIAQILTSNGAAGGFLTVNIGYGIGLIVALYVSIGVSGGHLNPAVTLAMALRGKLSWLKVWLAYFPVTVNLIMNIDNNHACRYFVMFHLRDITFTCLQFSSASVCLSLTGWDRVWRQGWYS